MIPKISASRWKNAKKAALILLPVAIVCAVLVTNQCSRAEDGNIVAPRKDFKVKEAPAAMLRESKIAQVEINAEKNTKSMIVKSPEHYKACEVEWHKLFISEGGPVIFDPSSKYALRLTSDGWLEVRNLQHYDPDNEQKLRSPSTRSLIYQDKSWIHKLSGNSIKPSYTLYSLSMLEFVKGVDREKPRLLIKLPDRVELFEIDLDQMEMRLSKKIPINEKHRPASRAQFIPGFNQLVWNENALDFQQSKIVKSVVKDNFDSVAVSANEKFYATAKLEPASAGTYLVHLKVRDFRSHRLIKEKSIRSATYFNVLSFTADNRIFMPHYAELNGELNVTWDWARTDKWSCLDRNVNRINSTNLSPDGSLFAVYDSNELAIYRSSDSSKLLVCKSYAVNVLKNATFESGNFSSYHNNAIEFSSDSSYLAFTGNNFVEFFKLKLENKAIGKNGTSPK